MAEPKQVQFEQREVGVRWPETLDVVSAPNVFNIQVTPDGIVVTIGQAAQPIFSGSAEEQIRQAHEVTEVQATVMARLLLNPARAAELMAGLGQALAAIQVANAQLMQSAQTQVPAQ